MWYVLHGICHSGLSLITERGDIMKPAQLSHALRIWDGEHLRRRRRILSLALNEADRMLLAAIGAPGRTRMKP